jgi:hypothetical protein
LPIAVTVPHNCGKCYSYLAAFLSTSGRSYLPWRVEKYFENTNRLATSLEEKLIEYCYDEKLDGAILKRLKEILPHLSSTNQQLIDAIVYLCFEHPQCEQIGKFSWFKLPFYNPKAVAYVINILENSSSFSSNKVEKAEYLLMSIAKGHRQTINKLLTLFLNYLKEASSPESFYHLYDILKSIAHSDRIAQQEIISLISNNELSPKSFNQAVMFLVGISENNSEIANALRLIYTRKEINENNRDNIISYILSIDQPDEKGIGDNCFLISELNKEDIPLEVRLQICGYILWKDKEVRHKESIINFLTNTFKRSNLAQELYLEVIRLFNIIALENNTLLDIILESINTKTGLFNLSLSINLISNYILASQINNLSRDLEQIDLYYNGNWNNKLEFNDTEKIFIKAKLIADKLRLIVNSLATLLDEDVYFDLVLKSLDSLGIVLNLLIDLLNKWTKDIQMRLGSHFWFNEEKVKELIFINKATKKEIAKLLISKIDNKSLNTTNDISMFILWDAVNEQIVDRIVSELPHLSSRVLTYLGYLEAGKELIVYNLVSKLESSSSIDYENIVTVQGV